MKPNQYNPNVNLNQPNMQQPPSYQATQEEQNSRHLGINEKKVCFSFVLGVDVGIYE